MERRQVPRFGGRAVNFAGWVLRNLGAAQEALDHHTEALEVARRQGTAEVTIAALEDLAEQCLDTGDAEGARSWLAQAQAVLQDEARTGPYRLWSGDTEVKVGSHARIVGEVARSEGVAGGTFVSEDGGLSFADTDSAAVIAGIAVNPRSKLASDLPPSPDRGEAVSETAI